MKRKIILLCGPTAVGNSEIGLRLAKELNGEIVSADSGQVWKELDIGTAKPSPADRRDIPHHLIDVANPDEIFNVSRYVALADQAVTEIHCRGRIPIVVGGAGLYIQTLLYGLCEAPPQDPEVREKLQQQLATEGVASLHARLREIDPGVLSRIHPNDKTRTIRSLEVYELTGYPMSHFIERHQKENPRYEALQMGLNLDRAKLHERIHKRVDWMFASGWDEEVKELLKFYPADSQALQLIGYKQIVSFLRGEQSLIETKEEIKKQTRQLARRQLTWFRSDKNIDWIQVNPYKNVLKRVRQFL